MTAPARLVPRRPSAPMVQLRVLVGGDTQDETAAHAVTALTKARQERGARQGEAEAAMLENDALRAELAAVRAENGCLWRDNRQATRNLGDVQARCTELLLEVRELKGSPAKAEEGTE